jgi:hypothetical protein
MYLFRLQLVRKNREGSTICLDGDIMSVFRKQSQDFLKQVSRAAEWMLNRSVGPRAHWWKSWVLTSRHTKDPDRNRPVFDDETAKRIFAELKRRGLLADENEDGKKFLTDEPEYQVYLMQPNIKGWDDVIAEGRPVYGHWLRAKRAWPAMIAVFLLGGVANKGFDWTMDYMKERIAGVPQQAGAPLQPNPVPPQQTAPAPEPVRDRAKE